MEVEKLTGVLRTPGPGMVLRPVDFDLAAEAYKVRGRWLHCATAPFAPTPCGAQPHLGQGYAPTPLVT